MATSATSSRNERFYGESCRSGSPFGMAGNPPKCDVHRRDPQCPVHVDSGRVRHVSFAQIPVIARGCAEWANRPFADLKFDATYSGNAPMSEH
jgi:hypothetical protein